ncbi:MAG: hypothetical protein MZV70_16710 [Desulfobacterales bacterium]|nr:hypothetical protein [Desulfobacterales bacterium]
MQSDALARTEVTPELTENLYSRGSGRVKKTDYLRNKTVVEGLRSALAFLERQRKVCQGGTRQHHGTGLGRPDRTCRAGAHSFCALRSKREGACRGRIRVQSRLGKAPCAGLRCGGGKNR